MMRAANLLPASRNLRAMTAAQLFPARGNRRVLPASRNLRATTVERGTMVAAASLAEPSATHAIESASRRAVEDLVVTHGAQAELPVCGRARVGVGADQCDQLDAGARAQLDTLRSLAEQVDRTFERLLGVRDFGGQLGRGRLRSHGLRVFCHLRSVPAMRITMQAAPTRRLALQHSWALQTVVRVPIARCLGPSRSSRAAKQFHDRVLRRPDRSLFRVKTGGLRGLWAEGVEFRRTSPLNRHRAPKGGVLRRRER